jgi:hypothetical protein
MEFIVYSVFIISEYINSFPLLLIRLLLSVMEDRSIQNSCADPRYILLKLKTLKSKLRGLYSPQANYTDRATAACRPS